MNFGTFAGELKGNPVVGLPTIYIVRATTQNALPNFHYILINSALTTVTLPRNPAPGDTVYVTVANGLVTNVVSRNGNNIESLAEDMTLNAAYASAQLRFTNPTVGWVLA